MADLLDDHILDEVPELAIIGTKESIANEFMVLPDNGSTVEIIFASPTKAAVSGATCSDLIYIDSDSSSEEHSSCEVVGPSKKSR
uniref:Uncharacterized protein n=1 Tax=Amphimedon queenslandica TaxID=400682 RepID=A0A1X7USJ7_AMPQE